MTGTPENECKRWMIAVKNCGKRSVASSRRNNFEMHWTVFPCNSSFTWLKYINKQCMGSLGLLPSKLFVLFEKFISYHVSQVLYM